MVATLVAEELGRDPSTIAVIRDDSLTGMPSQSPAGSRMTIVLGQAIRGAADELKAKLIRIAAHNLGAGKDTVRYVDGHVVVTSDPGTGIGWTGHTARPTCPRRRGSGCCGHAGQVSQDIEDAGAAPGHQVLSFGHDPREGGGFRSRALCRARSIAFVNHRQEFGA